MRRVYLLVTLTIPLVFCASCPGKLFSSETGLDSQKPPAAKSGAEPPGKLEPLPKESEERGTGILTGSEIKAGKIPKETPDRSKREPQSLHDCIRAAAHFDRARAAGGTDEKILFLKMGLELCPEDADAQTALGRAYLEEGRRKEASEALKKALELDPESDEAQALLNSLR